MGPIAQGIVGGLAAGAATGLGAAGVYSVRELSRRGEVWLLSSAAGIMLAATFFALLEPAVDAASARAGSARAAALAVGGAVALGIVLLSLVHRLVPHEHFETGREGLDVRTIRRIWLFVFAIALHNLPEGLAVAAGLTAIGYRRGVAFAVSLGTGVLEAVGAAAGAAFASLTAALLPWALGFAGGAMLFVITSEIIPETHRGDSKREASFALLAGFLLMMMLDVALG